MINWLRNVVMKIYELKSDGKISNWWAKLIMIIKKINVVIGIL